MDRVYASGFVGRIGALAGAIVAVPLVAIGVPLVVLQQILGVRNSKLLIAVSVGILIVGGVWVLVHVFITGPIRFETDARSVRLRKGLRVTNEWQRAGTVFGSLVTRQSTNGIPSGSQRVVFATTANERVEVPARWFSATKFNDLMADLSPVTALAQAATTPAERSRTFTLDPRAARLRGPLRVARIPISITVTGSTLQIDDRVLYWGQLASVEVSPPTYSGNRRAISLVEKVGTRTGYQLGSGNPAGASVFPEYAEFVDLLAKLAPAGVVRFDLR